MSGGGEAHVQLANHTAFKEMMLGAARKPSKFRDFRATMIINGEIRQGWEFADIKIGDKPDAGDKFAIVLRHPIDERIGTAEYACVFTDGHGDHIQVAQFVVIQNDNDYEDAGIERFGLLTHHATRG